MRSFIRSRYFRAVALMLALTLGAGCPGIGVGGT